MSKKTIKRVLKHKCSEYKLVRVLKHNFISKQYQYNDLRVEPSRSEATAPKRHRPHTLDSHS